MISEKIKRKKLVQNKNTLSYLLPFEKYSKINSLFIDTSERIKNKDNHHNEKNVKRQYKTDLEKIADYYINLAENISDRIIDEKFEKIFEDIYHFVKVMQFYNDTFYQTLVLNTDQNADLFFNSMENYFKKNNYSIIFKFDHHFQDIKGLVKDLSITKYFDEENIIKPSYVKDDSGRIIRLIIIREIEKIDYLNLNVFINKIIEYESNDDRIFKNIIVFDVGYDPRGLYDKIKPNILTKIIFNNIEHIASKDIYKQILYEFVYKSGTIFIPNTINLKKVVDLVNNHQISVHSFKNYFKLLIIDFFLLNEWDNEEFLIFSKKLQGSDGNITEYLKKKLNYYIKPKFSVDKIYSIYESRKKTRDYFFQIYKILENLSSDIAIENKTNFNKFQFFFEFLQFGTEKEKLINRRRDLIKKYIFQDKANCFEIVFEKIIPRLKSIVSQKKDELNVNLNEEIFKLEDKLNTNKNTSIFISKNMRKDILNTCSIKPDSKIDLPSTLSNYDVLNIFNDWLLSFLKLKCFVEIVCYDKKNNLNFLNFTDLTTPSLSLLIVKDISNIAEKASKDIKNDYSYLLKNFLIVYGNLGIEYKLKFFYADYLQQFIELDDIKNNKFVELIRLIFLKLCHQFYILGLISRKRAKGDTFIKNYFEISSGYYT